MHTARNNVRIRFFISLSLSFRPQGFHRLEPGGLCRRINAEQNSSATDSVKAHMVIHAAG